MVTLKSKFNPELNALYRMFIGRAGTPLYNRSCKLTVSKTDRNRVTKNKTLAFAQPKRLMLTDRSWLRYI
jgi:hypothetical protein